MRRLQLVMHHLEERVRAERIPAEGFLVTTIYPDGHTTTRRLAART